MRYFFYMLWYLWSWLPLCRGSWPRSAAPRWPPVTSGSSWWRGRRTDGCWPWPCSCSWSSGRTAGSPCSAGGSGSGVWPCLPLGWCRRNGSQTHSIEYGNKKYTKNLLQYIQRNIRHHFIFAGFITNVSEEIQDWTIFSLYYSWTKI